MLCRPMVHSTHGEARGPPRAKTAAATADADHLMPFPLMAPKLAELWASEPARVRGSDLWQPLRNNVYMIHV